ncbi:MAG: PH domain-containing protein [Candidatus Magasanikbacteria bacterium]
MKIKPEKLPFIAFNLLGRFLIGIVAVGILYLVYHFNLLLLLLLLLVFLVWSYYNGTISYRKEEYIIKENKLIRKSGGIFSDAEQELNISNITHLELNRGLIARKVFGVGSVIIESAGSQTEEIDISSVKNPEKIFQVMQDKMKQAGFQIDRNEMLEEDKPSKVAIILELAGSFFGALFLVLFLVITFPIIAVPLILLIILIVVFRYYDLKRRKYSLYSGKIVEEKDFLSKVYTIVPIENLADSNLEQNFLNKILGLYDLKLSCQGSGSEISFKNINKGKAFDEKIDKLIKSQEAVSLKTKEKQQTETKNKTKDKQTKSKPKTRGLDSIPQVFQSFKKDFHKAILTPLIVILSVLVLFFTFSAIIWVLSWFFGGALTIFSILNFLSTPILWLILVFVLPSFSITVKYFATEYSIKEQSIREEYSLFRTNIKEFSDDKVTGIYFKESLLDRIFGTYTIHFWSIGSNEDIEFSGIKQNDQLEDILEEKYNFDINSENHSIVPEFSFFKMLKQKTILLVVAALFFLIFAGVNVAISSKVDNISAVWGIFVGLLLLFFLFIFGLYVYKAYYYDKAYLSFFSDFLVSKQGLINKYKYFVNYDDVKGIITTKYPWTMAGEVKFKVSGEHTIGTGDSKTTSSNEVSLGFINNILAKDELIDLVLEQKQDFRQMNEIEQNIDKYRKEDIITSSPDLANSLVSMLLLSIIIFPFIVLLPIAIPTVIWRNKKKSYHLKPYRVLYKSGVLFKSQHSIVFQKIDHINKNQGIFNKMFNNGNISINTVASSETEMTLENLPDYEEFYKKIQEIY